MAYSIHKREGSGATLDNFRFRPTFWFELRHDDGTVAAKTSAYFTDSVTGRQLNGCRLQMARLLPRYEAYLERTGKRWEIEQEEKLKVERAAKKKADRIAYLRKTIPLFTAELAELTKEGP